MIKWAYPVRTCVQSIPEGTDTCTPDHCHYRSHHSGRIESGSLDLIDKVNKKRCSLGNSISTGETCRFARLTVVFTYLFHKFCQPIQQDMCSGSHWHHCGMFHCSCKVTKHRSLLLQQKQKCFSVSTLSTHRKLIGF